LTKSYICPVDQNPLVMSDRQGIEIDYCPVCRGIWLDRGELDKIIERSSAPGVSRPLPDSGYGRSQSHGDHRSYGRPKRKKSFLEELFD
jgi:Zn-finger nucleic acid-binding protein